MDIEDFKPITPTEIDSLILGFCKTVHPTNDPIYVQVKPTPLAVHTWCYNNLFHHRKKYGGEVIMGWCIWYAKLTHVEAESHCIWKSPKGELVDITPKPDGEQRILFIPDERNKFEGFEDHEGNWQQRTIKSIRNPFTPLAIFDMQIGNRRDDERLKNYLKSEKQFREDIEQFKKDYERDKKTLVEEALEIGPISPNAPCPCASYKKFKNCCMYKFS